MKPSHVLGIACFRGGLAIAGGWSFYRSARWLLRWWDMPVRVEIGLALLGAGAAMIILSFVLELFHDRRMEAHT